MARTSSRPPAAADGPALGAVERILAGIFVGIIALSVIAFIVLMVGSVNEWFDAPTYAFIVALVLFGLPVGIVLMLVLTIRLAIRRSRANRAR